MAVSRVDVQTTVPAGTASFAVTMPTHASGDRILIAAIGKYDTTSAPTIDNGTLLGMHTGGTGTTGNDVGPMFCAVFGIDADSSSETATVTAGGTAPNSWVGIAAAYRPTSGKTWRDALATSAAYVTSASDTDTATPLTGTAGAFTGVQPTTDDAIVSFGGTPTNSGTAAASTPTMTATGLSGGTIAAKTYAETTLNANCCGVQSDWTGFTGTASAGVAASYTITSATNLSGVLVAVALRETSAGSDATVTPSAIVTASTVPAPTVQTDSTVTPAAIATTSTVPAPTIQTGSTVTPAAIATVSALPAPTIQTGSTVTPTAIATVSTLPAPTISTGNNATVTPAAVATVSTLPAPVVQTGSTVTPSAIATVTTLPAPTISGSVTVQPGVIVTVTTLPAPTVGTGSTVTPAAIATVTALPIPSVVVPVSGIGGNVYPRDSRSVLGSGYPSSSSSIIGSVG